MIAIGRKSLTDYVPCRRALQKSLVQQGQTNLFDSLTTQLNHASETSKSLPKTNEFIFNIVRIQATVPSFRFSDLIYRRADQPTHKKPFQSIQKYANRPLRKSLIYENSSILFFKERLNRVGLSLTSSGKKERIFDYSNCKAVL